MTDPGFPLPLTPFERYLVLDERPGYPMTFLGVFDFRGSFRKDVLECAAIRALQRNPLLRATVRGRRWWTEPRATERAFRVQWLSWSEEPPREAFARIDLRREIGVRLFVQQDAERSRWNVQVHHAAVDGLGVIDFARDVLVAYAAAADDAGAAPGSRSPDAFPDTSSVAQRGRSRRAPRPPASREPGVPAAVSLADKMRFMLRRPSVIRSSGAGEGSGPGPHLLAHAFDAAAAASIRTVAAAHGGTSNDVFLCALFRMLSAWNSPGDPYRSKRWLRVLVPTNLRDADDRGLGAANVLGYAFLDRRERDCADVGTLLGGIAQEMRWVRAHRIGRLFVEGLGLVDRVPGLLRFIARRRTPFATCVFSNITGAPVIDVQGLLPRLWRVTGYVPTRPGTRATFLLSRVDTTTTLTLSTDPRFLDEDASERFLFSYVRALNEVLAQGAGT